MRKNFEVDVKNVVRNEGSLTIRYLPVRCLVCDTKWVAVSGRGKGAFTELIDSLEISCTNADCNNAGNIPYSELK